jgi:hypothetical protein
VQEQLIPWSRSSPYLGAGAAHGWAEEEVDDEHDEEEDPECDAEVEQPDRVHPTVLTQGFHLNCK